MMNNPEILVIDDEEQIQKLLRITLQTNQFKMSGALSAREGLRAAQTINPDLIMLDLGLPDESGHEVLKKLRAWFTKPIIILTVQNNEEDIVKALDNGANDYLVKPFRTGELLARIRSALRSKTEVENNSLITCGNLEIDLAARVVRKNNDIIKLTATEYTLFALLVKNEGK